MLYSMYRMGTTGASPHGFRITASTLNEMGYRPDVERQLSHQPTVTTWETCLQPAQYMDERSNDAGLGGLS